MCAFTAAVAQAAVWQKSHRLRLRTAVSHRTALHGRKTTGSFSLQSGHPITARSAQLSPSGLNTAFDHEPTSKVETTLGGLPGFMGLQDNRTYLKCREAKGMELSEALKITRLLSEGIDPETGEVLEDESTFNEPRVIRALAVAVNALERVQKIESRKGPLPDNAGKAWATEEDSELVKAFENGASIGELAVEHSRTKGAISARLVRLGKLS